MATRRQFIGTFGALLAAPAWALPSSADTTKLRLALVVAKSSPINDLSSQDLKNLYRGDRLAGPKIIPFAFPAGSPERVAFDHAVLGLSPESAAQYWIDRKIRGQSGPPTPVDSPELLQRVVAKLDGALGYVRATDVKDFVKAIRIDGKSFSDSDYPVEY